MKIKLKKYSRKYPLIFRKEKAILSKLGRFEIHHIGSTAVKGMPGKGWIDMLIIAKNKKQRDSLINKLQKIGYKKARVKDKDRIFFSIKRDKQQYNLHLMVKGKKALERIKFRDYLRKSKKEAERYLQLKKDNFKKAKGDRVVYRKLKEDYFREIIRKI